MRAPRENAIWIRDLRACGPVQAEAITDLRGLLLRGLAMSFQARGALDQAFVEGARPSRSREVEDEVFHGGVVVASLTIFVLVVHEY